MEVWANDGAIFIDVGDTAPTTDRAGLLLSAQGEFRKIVVVSEKPVWARSLDEADHVVTISGPIGLGTSEPPSQV
jgi:hypothetical protein